MKRNIFFILGIFLLFPLFSQEIIELQDVTTTVTGAEQNLEESSLPDFTEILPIPEEMLPQLETNLPEIELEKEQITSSEENFNDYTYFEGNIGAGYPSLFIGDFMLSRSEKNNYYNFGFFHETENGYGIQESNKGFFDNLTSVNVDGTINFTPNFNLDFVGSYENTQFGLQSLSPIFYSTNLQQSALGLNLEFICNDYIQLYADLNSIFSSWYASYVPTSESIDLLTNLWRLNVSPRLGLAGNSGIFTCFFEGGYDLNTSKGTLDSILHRGELLYYMDFRFGDFLLKTDVGLVFVDKNIIPPFSVGFEFSRNIELSMEGGLRSSVLDVFNLEKNPIMFNNVKSEEQTQWFATLDFMFPIGSFCENNLKVDFALSSFDNNLIVPDYSLLDEKTGLYGFSEFSKPLLTTEYSLLFYFEKSQLNFSWNAWWLNLPENFGIAPHEVSLLYSFVPTKNNWGFSLWATMNFGGNREILGDIIPDTGLSFFIRSAKSFKFTLEVNDMIKLFSGTERTLCESYIKNSGSASIFVSFYL